jgi:hypothetical protein
MITLQLANRYLSSFDKNSKCPVPTGANPPKSNHSIQSQHTQKFHQKSDHSIHLTYCNSLQYSKTMCITRQTTPKTNYIILALVA